MVSAATVAANVAIMQGMNISVGFAAGGVIEALMAIILMGIKVRPEACSTKNMIWALLAVSLFGFSVCRLSMAFRPNGVAALSNPSRLAEKFIIMCPYAGCLGGSSGNNLLKKGATIFDRKRMAPAFSPMFIKPRNNVMIPISLKERSTLSLADLKIPSVTVLKIRGSPVITHFPKAMAKAMMKKKNQI